MKKILKRYMPDGSVRGIWDDSTAKRERSQGSVPHRASRIEAIEEGPNAGLFHVDFTPLAEMTGRDEFRLCLARAFESYEEARRAEVEWLTHNYVLEGLPKAQEVCPC